MTVAVTNIDDRQVAGALIAKTAEPFEVTLKALRHVNRCGFAHQGDWMNLNRGAQVLGLWRLMRRAGCWSLGGLCPDAHGRTGAPKLCGCGGQDCYRGAGPTWRHRQQRERGRCRAEATHKPDGLVGVLMSYRTSGSDLGRDAVDQPGPR
jgi:hypothetical protein